eukprot:TRINITY_DN10022_c0_g1_i1.p1 TRINITY_DN10022_c0_g1~~TRINITY_DN10022_c0_g1_i1.p1  ORF type:complete len:206 (-),score=54.11 TRINITY_DN10022_c0_g1_i1:85-654(-)
MCAAPPMPPPPPPAFSSPTMQRLAVNSTKRKVEEIEKKIEATSTGVVVTADLLSKVKLRSVSKSSDRTKITTASSSTSASASFKVPSKSPFQPVTLQDISNVRLRSNTTPLISAAKKAQTPTSPIAKALTAPAGVQLRKIQKSPGGTPIRAHKNPVISPIMRAITQKFKGANDENANPNASLPSSPSVW